MVSSAPPLPVPFEPRPGFESLASVDWPVMGEAVKEMDALFVELFDALAKGDPISPDLQGRIVEQNNKLVQLAAGVMASSQRLGLTKIGIVGSEQFIEE